jgi:hypothetical protein
VKYSKMSQISQTDESDHDLEEEENEDEMPEHLIQRESAKLRKKYRTMKDDFNGQQTTN